MYVGASDEAALPKTGEIISKMKKKEMAVQMKKTEKGRKIVKDASSRS